MNYINGIYGMFGDYRWLSNYQILKNPVQMFGFEYYHTEGAYQAAKSTDPEFHKAMSLLLKPHDAKKAGSRTNKSLVLRPDWEKINENIMYEVNRQRFDKNGIWKEKLMETGDRYIEESNWWNDDFWGCHVADSKEELLALTRTEPSPRGLNRLGWCLMTLRMHYNNA